VFSDRLQDVEELEIRICLEVGSITKDIVRAVMNILKNCLLQCIANKGSVIFYPNG
jgi:hypothetical protein